jgi:hypothetical protein
VNTVEILTEAAGITAAPGTLTERLSLCSP